MKQRIRFQGKEYLLIGDVERGGPIATQEESDNFEISYAYLHPDGTIARLNQNIGTIDDIRFIKDAEPELKKLS